MTLTELALLPALSPSFTPALKAATERAMATQDAWLAKHHHPDLEPPLSPPPSRAARGVALLQQIEDPKVYLRTGTWDSAEQVGAWKGSEEGRGIIGFLKEEFDLKGVARWEVEGDLIVGRGASANTIKEDGDEVGLLDAPIVSQTSVRVRAEDKEEFARLWGEVRGSLVEFAAPYAVRDGWVIGGGHDEEALLFITAGWPTVEKHLWFNDSQAFKEARPALSKFGTFADAKHYRRVW